MAEPVIAGAERAELLAVLADRARFVRTETLRLIAIAGSGHYTSVFSSAELFATLYYHTLRIRPEEPNWDNRDRLTSIQVLGNEPFIPWELVHLREPGKPFPEETRFLGQMGLVRWLYQGGWPPSELRVRPGQARYVIPEYPDPRYQLPETIAERMSEKETRAVAEYMASMP